MSVKVFQMRTQDGFLQVVDEWRSTRRPIPPRAEAIRHLTEKGLEAYRKEAEGRSEGGAQA